MQRVESDGRTASDLELGTVRDEYTWLGHIAAITHQVRDPVSDSVFVLQSSSSKSQSCKEMPLLQGIINILEMTRPTRERSSIEA